MSKLLFVIEVGGFPLKFDALQAAGHEVEYTNNMRKAVSLVKKFQPDIMVAEFQYTSQFRDRDSNLDTIMTQIVSRSTHTRVIALVEQEYRAHYERLKSRFDNIRDELYFPFESDDLDNAILMLLEEQAD